MLVVNNVLLIITFQLQASLPESDISWLL